MILVCWPNILSRHNHLLLAEKGSFGIVFLEVEILFSHSLRCLKLFI